MFLTLAARVFLLSALLVALTRAQDVTTVVPDGNDSTTTSPVVESSTTTPMSEAPVGAETTTTPVVESSTTTPMSEAPVGAEATTTSVPRPPPPPYRCYECDSGSSLKGMWYNQNCRVDGVISEWAYISSCPTFCYSYVGRYPAGTVFRGCAKNLYLGESQPVEGCYEDPANKRYVCLCAGDLCNQHSLHVQSDAYVRQEENKQP